MFYYVNFFDILVFTEGILGISFCHSLLKILGENKMLYIIKQIIYEQGPQ